MCGKTVSNSFLIGKGTLVVRIKKMHSILTTRVPFPIKKKSELKT
jgi:hypothetical protein